MNWIIAQLLKYAFVTSISYAPPLMSMVEPKLNIDPEIEKYIKESDFIDLMKKLSYVKNLNPKEKEHYLKLAKEIAKEKEADFKTGKFSNVDIARTIIDALACAPSLYFLVQCLINKDDFDAINLEHSTSTYYSGLACSAATAVSGIYNFYKGLGRQNVANGYMSACAIKDLVESIETK